MAVINHTRPCSPQEALLRTIAVVGRGGQYVLGTGDYRPRGTVDLPWTTRDGMTGSDCAGLICYAYKLRRHRHGFNRGKWATVCDDINTDSLVEDAHNRQELCEVIHRPEPGALIVYKSIRIVAKQFKLIGHIGLIESVPAEWPMRTSPADYLTPQPYELLSVLQCKGPNGRAPGVIRTDGSIWSKHDAKWPKEGHRTVLLRMKR